MHRVGLGVVVCLAPAFALVASNVAGCSSSSSPSSPPPSVAPAMGSSPASDPLGADLFAAIPRRPHVAVCADPGRAGWARCLSRVVVDASGKPLASATPQGYGPSDVQRAYALPTSGGAGQVVGIVDAYDDPNAESDLAVYRSHYGLPPCTTANGCFKKVNQSGVQGNYPTPPSAADAAWDIEIALDLDAVSAACPACRIVLVEATTADLGDLGASVNTAVRLGATVVSNSYGGSEDTTNAQSSTSYYDHPGVLVTASTGDSGYGVEFPASSPYVLGVGGTSLVQASGTTRGWAESAWKSGGSGCSAYAPKPSWQKDTGCAFKTVADVAAVADPNTGIAIYDTANSAGGWMLMGGTSLASPLVAAIFALTGRAASDPSFAYANATWFNDVTSGSNGSCSGSYLCIAGAGYDGPTGVGSPNAALWNGDGGDDAGAPPPDGGTNAGPPSVSLVSPADGAPLATNATITIVADVSAPAGIATTVLEWQMPSGTVAVDCDAPPSNTTCTRAATGRTTWSFPGTTGSRTWWIVATDAAGRSATSAKRTLTLGAAASASIAFTSPAQWTAYRAGGTVPVRVTATAPSGVSQVWLTWTPPSGQSTQMQLSSLGGGQYGLNVPISTSAVAGTRWLTATAYDATNATLGSAQIGITVQ